MQHHRLSGFSLIELLISITIVLTLTGLAMPNFASLTTKTRLSSTSNALFESLYLARSYAISSQKKVHVCHLNDDGSETCSNDREYNSNWSSGWLVFIDKNGNNDHDSDDEIISIIRKKQNINVVFNQRGRLRFFPDGSARSAGFYLCDKHSKTFKHIYLLHSGRARVNELLTEKQQETCQQVDLT